MLKTPINIAIFGGYLIIVVLLGMFLWKALFSPGYDANPDAHGKPTQSEQQPPAEDPSWGGSPQAAKNATDEAIAYYTKWLAFFTLCLVLATIALFVSGERNVEAAARSADAAKKAADASRDAVNLSKETAQRQLRAYVFVDAATVNLSDQTLRAVVTVKNSGQTPAYDLGTEIGIHTRANEKTNPIPPKETDLDPRGILPPGGETFLPKDLTVPVPAENGGIDIIQLARDGKLHIYITGWLAYRDAFGRRQNLEFKLKSFKFTGQSWFMEYTPDGNKETTEDNRQTK